MRCVATSVFTGDGVCRNEAVVGERCAYHADDDHAARRRAAAFETGRALRPDLATTRRRDTPMSSWRR